MVRLPDKFDPIEYLVERKFPLLRIANIPVSISSTARTPRFDGAKIRREAELYRAELAALQPEELDALHKAERARELAQAVAKAAKEEAARFFNQPVAIGDFEHWSKAQYWTIDEAIALSLGKAPERVNWATVKPMVDFSPFAQQYRRVRDLALRAVNWKALFDPILPALFLDWTRANELPFPDDLAQRVTARRGNALNWRLLYDKLKEDKEREISELRSALANKFEPSEEPSGPTGGPTKRQSEGSTTRERDSLLKLVITMATKKYRYDPSGARSDSVGRIRRDMDECGLSLDEGTILKYLRQGANLLPPK